MNTTRHLTDRPFRVALLLALSGPLAGVVRAQTEDEERPCCGTSSTSFEVGPVDGETLAPCVFEGFVLAPNGAPAVDALVVTSAGGKAVVDASGHYRLEAQLPPGTEQVHVTAIGAGGQSLVASASVDLGSGVARVSVDPLALAAVSSCSPSWLPTFGGQPGLGDARNAYALAVFDDGSGPALYVGGDFGNAGGVVALGVVKWDGSSWSPLGSGVVGWVYALAVHDDGSGLALYAGGDFTQAGGGAANHIARWNGTSWSALGSGINGPVNCLAEYDDGTGPALFAGGRFSTAGGLSAGGVAKWSGSSWSDIGAAIFPSSQVKALAVYDDGGGPALYVGGFFTFAGFMSANGIARWDGASWSALGSGTGGVSALAVYNDGSGSALYAGGSFTSAGGVPASCVARWDGTSWAALGSGLGNSFSTPDCYSLAVYDDGGGAALYAGGFFDLAGGAPAGYIARWDGSAWSQPSGGADDSVRAQVVYDDGTGPKLFIGGRFKLAGGLAANRLARWDGASWSALGSGLSARVRALAVYDDGSGPALYVGGDFLGVDGLRVNCIARWDGTNWSALGSGFGGIAIGATVNALIVYDDGSGPALYAGGQYTTAGGLPASRIARWDGISWSALGSGASTLVSALAVYDDGSGPALYAGGAFATAGGVAVNHIARWNGASWSALGTGVSGSTVYALAVFDDGTGPALYVGGDLLSAGGVMANRIAKWNGTSWAALGAGMNANVFALATFDDGSGPRLFAGGQFSSAGGVSAFRIARWNGSTWSPVAGGVDGDVYGLTVHDDGGGPALYAIGSFSAYFPGGVPASRIARWDGSSWSALGNGMGPGSAGSESLALASFDDGTGPGLYAGGGAEAVPDCGDSYLAKWGYGPIDTTPPTPLCPPLVFARDSGAPGEVVTFSVLGSDCQDPAPVVTCSPPSGSFFPRGTTIVTCTVTDASGNQGTGQFPVIVEVKPVRPR